MVCDGLREEGFLGFLRSVRFPGFLRFSGFVWFLGLVWFPGLARFLRFLGFRFERVTGARPWL
jgi:hypothetical protein